MPRNSLTANKIAWNFIQANANLTEILIYDVIADKQSYNWWTDEKGTEVTPKIFREEINKVATQSICVRINSGGGDVFAAEAIRTAILENRQAGKTITCKIDGFCGSAAVGIADACESIAISSSSYFMMHDPSVFAHGYYNVADLGKVIEMLNKIKQGIINAYAQKTGKDKAEISDLMTQETWYTGDEAVEKGFCDELMFEDMDKDDSVQNAVNATAFNLGLYHNMPTSLLNRCSQPNGGFSNTSKPKTVKESVTNMEEIKAIDQLQAAYPELTQQIANNATLAERTRIKDIEDMALNGFESIVNTAKFEKPASAADVAMNIVAEQKKQGAAYLAGVKDDSTDSGVNGVAAGSHEGANDKTNPYDAAIDKVLPEIK